jgi:hypothetical protein
LPYIINNVILGILTLISIVSSLFLWLKLQNNNYNLSLKEWLRIRIRLLSGWLEGKYGKLYLILIPILYILCVLSIHVYFENKPLIAVLNNEESFIGLFLALPIGLFVSFYTVSKIRKHQIENLQFLKDIFNRICKLN